MHVPSLILFMGSEASGLYQYAGIFKNMGIPCGMPYAFLRSTLAAKRMPSHEYHSYFSAIRRFFGDLGLPPIAEAPPDRIGRSEFEYYSNLVCRCLLSHTAKNPYLCADHLTALVLPFVLQAIDPGTIRLKSYFFFTNPEKMVNGRPGSKYYCCIFRNINFLLTEFLGSQTLYLDKWAEYNIHSIFLGNLIVRGFI